jgi:hypothetical protein
MQERNALTEQEAIALGIEAMRATCRASDAMPSLLARD